MAAHLVRLALPTPASLAYPAILLACAAGLLPTPLGRVVAVVWVLGVVLEGTR